MDDYRDITRAHESPTALFFIFYGTFRTLIEFVRVPDADIGYLAGGWLTMGMVLSVPMVLLGLGLLGYAYAKPTPSGNYGAEPAVTAAS